MIWVIGGTEKSKEVIDCLYSLKRDFIVSVASLMGSYFLDERKMNVHTGKMDKDEMVSFIKANKIDSIVDVSHPFATIVSENAIWASVNTGCKYYRLEREDKRYKNALYFKSYSEINDYLASCEGNILLTIGIRNLSSFNSLDRVRLFVKIMSDADSFNECVKQNIKRENIIAMKGIISSNLVSSIIKEFDIKYLVTKDSGVEGGMDEKYNASLQSDIKFIVLSKPYIEYPNVFYKLDDVMAKLK